MRSPTLQCSARSRRIAAACASIPSPDFDESDEPGVFLVGYPGGIERDEPDIMLAGGLLSRLRTDDTFDLTYLQTDAAISGGQSGGALVDAEGRMLGISGLGFAEEFALALSADDVAVAIERVIAGDERRVIPSVKDAKSGPETIELTEADPSRLVVIPAAGEPRDVTLSVGAEATVVVDVSTFFGESLGANDAAFALGAELAGEYGSDEAGQFGDVPELDEPSPGIYVFEIAADDDAVVVLATAGDDAPMTVEIDVPHVIFDETVEAGEVIVGTPVRSVLGRSTTCRPGRQRPTCRSTNCRPVAWPTRLLEQLRTSTADASTGRSSAPRRARARGRGSA